MKYEMTLFLLLGLLIVQPACTASPLFYSAEAIEATVIDAETRKPLEGVIVVANWQLEEGTFGGNVQAGQLMVMEAVTDKDGKFHFPGFGPKTVWKGHLVNEDPHLLLFKSGYEYKRLFNHISMSGYREHVLKQVRSSDWNGKTIEMKRFRGTQEEYAEHVHQLDNGLEWARYGDDCEWKKTPRILVALHRMSEYFNSQGVRLRGWQIGARIRKVADVGNEKQCGSPQEFFKNYQP